MLTNKKYLDLKLYPNRSLNKPSVLFIRLIFFILTSSIAIYFALLGAWPVAIFLIIDFLIIYYALSFNIKSTRAYDRIILKKKLLIRKKSAKGLVKEFSIDPTWLRLKVCYYNNSGHLSVISKGRSIEIGKFLNVKELKKLAKVIKKALIKRESEIFSS